MKNDRFQRQCLEISNFFPIFLVMIFSFLSCFPRNMRNMSVYGGMETRFYLVSGKLVCISCYPSNVILGRYSTFHGSRFVVSSFHEKFVRFRAISSSHKSRRRRRVHLPHVAPDLYQTLFSPLSFLFLSKRYTN